MRSITLAFGLVAGAVALAGCSKSSSPSSPSSPSSTPSSNAVVISIVRQNGAQSFNPNPASAGGKVVMFRNDDSVVHRVVLNDGSIDTGNIQPGATSGAFTMPTDGTNYHCSLHPSMIGSVSAASGAAPPPCTGLYCDGVEP